MSRSVVYIVAFYAGKRRAHEGTTPVDLFFDEHVRFLSERPDHIKSAMFVLNRCGDDELDDVIRNKFKQMPDIGMKISLMERDNIGLSYGAWNDALFDVHEDYDFSFLIEDDYVPNRLDFIRFFFEVYDSCKDPKYVCSFKRKIGNGKIHASISNGLISNLKVSETIRRKGRLFKITEVNGYRGAARQQIDFLDLIDGSLEDITKVGHVLYASHIPKSSVIMYGDLVKPLIMKPV